MVKGKGAHPDVGRIREDVARPRIECDGAEG